MGPRLVTHSADGPGESSVVDQSENRAEDRHAADDEACSFLRGQLLTCGYAWDEPKQAVGLYQGQTHESDGWRSA